MKTAEKAGRWLPMLTLLGSLAGLSGCADLPKTIENSGNGQNNATFPANQSPSVATLKAEPPPPRKIINDGLPLTPFQISVWMEHRFPRSFRALCGPLTLFGFVKALGEPTISIEQALQAAKKVGWSPSDGMGGAKGRDGIARNSGRAAFLDMFRDYGFTLQRARHSEIRPVLESLDAVVPVVVHVVGKHYALAQDYRYQNGQLEFDMGKTFQVFKIAWQKNDPPDGQRWFTVDEMRKTGEIHFLYLPQPEKVAATPQTVKAESGLPIISTHQPFLSGTNVPEF